MKNNYLNLVASAALLIISCTLKAQPNLGSAAGFVVFTSNGAVGNTGITRLTGHVGSNSGSSTGFGNVNGTMHNNNGTTGTAATDLLTAYNQMNTAIPTFFPAPLLGNGQTLVAGVYAITGNATINQTLTLDAQSNPNAVFIIQIQGSLSSAAGAKVVLMNGALACKVFWKVEGLVSLAAGTNMKGNIVANNAAITMQSGVILEGRALSTTGAITLDNVKAYTPTGCGSPVLTGPATPSIGTSACFALLSGNGPVSNSGNTFANGDVGTNVGLTTGFNALNINGAIHPIPDGITGAAATDLLAGYNSINLLPSDIELLYPAQFGNSLVLTPHTYVLNGATMFVDTLFLDARNNASAVFVIKVNGALTTSTYAKVQLVNGAAAANVFWKIEGALDIDDYSEMVGTIICNNGAIDIGTGARLLGRALTTDGALAVNSITVTMPAACGNAPAAPQVLTQPGSMTVCPDAAAGFSVAATGSSLTYQWRRGTTNVTNSSNITGATTFSLSFAQVAAGDVATNYNVVVTNNGGSSTSSNAVLALKNCDVLTGINTTAAAKFIKVFPNPFSGNFTISGTASELSVRITNVLGAVVLEQKIPAEQALQLSLSPGMYFYSFSESGIIVQTGKLISQ